MMNVTTSKSLSDNAIDALEQALRSEKRRVETLQEELRQYKDLLARNAVAAEAENELISNKLGSQLIQLTKEKEKLVQEVEREEEYISNTLQRKLIELQNDKIRLENELEQEQECIVNKLQRKVSIMQKEQDEFHSKYLELASEVTKLKYFSASLDLASGDAKTHLDELQRFIQNLSIKDS